MSRRILRAALSVFAALLAWLLLQTAVGYTQFGPVVESIDPASVPAGRESTVSARGTNLTEAHTVTLIHDGQTDRVLETRLESPSLIQVLIPADLGVGTYRLQIQFEGSTDRFPFEVLAPRFAIDSVAPIEFWNNVAHELEVGGEGLSLRPLVFLGSSSLSDREVVSDTLMKVTVPSDFVSGEHELLFSLDGKEVVYKHKIQVHLYVEPEIESVTGTLLYNNKERTIVVSGRGFGDLDQVRLGNDSLAKEVSSAELFTATVRAGFAAGEYPLALSFKHGQLITYDQSIQIYNPIGAEVSGAEPNGFVGKGEREIVVHGTGLDQVRDVKLAWGRLRLITYDIDVTPEDSTTVKAIIETAKINDRNASQDERYTLRFTFPDDTDRVTEIRIYQSVLPSGFWAWIVIAVLWGVLATSAGMSYSNVIDKSATHLKNKTAPGVWTVAGLAAGTLARALVVGVIAGFIWGVCIANFDGFSIGRVRYLAVWLLTGSAVILAGQIAHWTGHFCEVWPGSVRLPIAAAVSLIGLGAPFVLDSDALIRWAVWFGAALVLTVGAVGVVGTILAQRMLALERKKGPSDEEIYGQVEQVLWRQGQVSAKDDFPDYPEDRVAKAQERYVTEHQEQEDLEYLPYAARLSFQRGEAVREFNECLVDLNKILEASPDAAEDIRNASRRLASVVCRQMSFAEGKPFRTNNGGPRFAVYSRVSENLESVLPTPFPLLVFHSSKAISRPDETDQLRRLQNTIGLSERFAILLAPSYAEETRRIIREELGGLARENIVVLGARDVLGMLVGRQSADEAFMKLVQEQVDLVILSPYQTKGPTNADMFFGRNTEISQVLESIGASSVAVLGARRIGKTSMLRYISQILEERKNVLLYLDGYFINNYESFFEQMVNTWQPLAPDLELRSYASINDFPRFVADLQSLYPERRIVFQFDEVDRLLWYDAHPERDELMFRMFRSLAQQQRCQFIFSGERTIQDKLHDPHSGFFNFTTPVRLGLLDREATRDLVQRPMKLVGIALRDADRISKTIYEATAGHPNLVQTVCEMLLRRAQDANIRYIDAAMTNEVVNTTDFKDGYLQTFWSQSTPLERAMSIAVCELETANERDILMKLREAGFQLTISQIQRGLRYLTLSQLLVSVDAGYTIQPKGFLAHLSSLTYTEWLENFVLEWQQSQEETAA